MVPSNYHLTIFVLQVFEYWCEFIGKSLIYLSFMGFTVYTLPISIGLFVSMFEIYIN